MTESAFVYITTYLIANHLGDPLYCDRGEGLTFNLDHSWVALPPPRLDPNWKCGDTVVIWSGGVMRTYPALDSWTNGSCIIEGDSCIKIGADVPEHLIWWKGLSTKAIITNQSEAKRQLEKER